MKLRTEPYVRKHIHRWVIHHELSAHTVRKCSDCDQMEAAQYAELLPFPKDVRAIADVEWTPLSPYMVDVVKKETKRR